MADGTETETLGKGISAKLVKLLEAAQELHGKQGEIIAEIDALLGGKASIGMKLKAAEQAFDRAWCARYAPGREKVYVWHYAKDRPHLKRLLKAMTVEDLAQRAARYIASEDGFLKKNRHTFGLFVSQINQFAGPGTEPQGLDLEPEDSGFTCEHTPRCRDDAEHTRRRSQELRS